MRTAIRSSYSAHTHLPRFSIYNNQAKLLPCMDLSGFGSQYRAVKTEQASFGFSRMLVPSFSSLHATRALAKNFPLFAFPFIEARNGGEQKEPAH